MSPEDVPDELVPWLVGDDMPSEAVIRALLATVLPAARRMWFREQYGDPIARRSEPLRPDDPAEILMRIRPDCVVVARADLEAYLNRSGDDLRAEIDAENRLRAALGEQP